MTPIFNPLRDKAELLNTHAQPYQHAFDQIADTITFADLSECPVCHSGEYIDYIQTANEPEHGTYGIAIGCTDCQIQTTGQHWFITSPDSALSALNAAIELWNRRPEQAITEDAEAVIPAQAGIQPSLDIIQDAARYQEIKRILHSWHISFAFLKGKPDNLVISLSMAGAVIATDNDELTGLKIDLDQTIDNSIAATQQPEAAK